jgi:urease accessory protein
MSPDVPAFLRLLQLADSALPVGAAAHSFGLETLTTNGDLTVAGLELFLRAWLEEAGALEATWCLEAARIESVTHWVRMNQTISAMKPARESREASMVLGRRFLDLASALMEDPALVELAAAGCEVHLAAAFGRTGRALGADPQTAAAAYLHQSLAGLISACQRLLPLGQRQASLLLWKLKPFILSTVDSPSPTCFLPALEIASMRHPGLPTRLFVS